MKIIKWNDTDRFILDRWSNVAELARSFRRTQVKMRRSLRAVKERLGGWARERGYEVDASERDGELWLYRPSWRKDADTHWAVLCVGGFYPIGYFTVDCQFPYRCVYLEALAHSRGEQRSNIAKAVRQELGAAAAAWQDRTEDQVCPLWQDLTEYDESKRCEFGGGTDKLYQFAVAEFDKLTGLSDAIDAALKKSVGSPPPPR